MASIHISYSQVEENICICERHILPGINCGICNVCNKKIVHVIRIWINYVFVQAEVEGQTITWLTPHLLQQVMSDDVDMPTMLNFLQFYEVGFILMFIFSVFEYINNHAITINKTVDILLISLTS